MQPPAALCSSPHARCCAHLVAARNAWLWLACLTDLPLASALRRRHRTRATSLRFELNVTTLVSAPPPAQALARAGSLDCLPLSAYAGALLAGRDRVAGRECARRESAAAQSSVAVPRRTPCSSRRPAAAMRAMCTRSCAPVCVRGVCTACHPAASHANARSAAVGAQAMICHFSRRLILLSSASPTGVSSGEAPRLKCEPGSTSPSSGMWVGVLFGASTWQRAVDGARAGAQRPSCLRSVCTSPLSAAPERSPLASARELSLAPHLRHIPATPATYHADCAYPIEQDAVAAWCAQLFEACAGAWCGVGVRLTLCCTLCYTLCYTLCSTVLHTTC